MWKRFFARRRYRRAIDQALAAMTARKPEAAREALGRAVAAATVAFDGRGLDLATTLYALAANQLEAGLLDEALISARESDRVLADTPEQDRAGSAPEETPSVARVRGLIAAILERRGVKGEEHETALLGWAEAARAEKDDEAAGAALNQLGLTLARRGDRAAAADLFLGALEHRTKRFGADGLPTLEALYNLATYRDEGRTLDVVATDLERIASTLEGRSEPRAAELKESTLHNLAALREEQGGLCRGRSAVRASAQVPRGAARADAHGAETHARSPRTAAPPRGQGHPRAGPLRPGARHRQEGARRRAPDRGRHLGVASGGDAGPRARGDPPQLSQLCCPYSAQEKETGQLSSMRMSSPHSSWALTHCS